MIEIAREMPWTELEGLLRQTPLLEPRDGQIIYPYEEADIRIDEMTYAGVAATTLYVLRSNMAAQAAIAVDLSMAGYNPLQLETGLVLSGVDSSLIGFTPPIVEESAEDGMYVLDGAHRATMGRWLGKESFLGIRVSGIRTDCPSYALPNSWDEIRLTEEVPSDASQKKHYRGDNYRALYRDFSVLNGSRLREAPTT